MKSQNTQDAADAIGRGGNAKEVIRFDTGPSSLGTILVASSDKGVVSILVGEDADELVRDLQQRFPKAGLVREGRDGEDLVARVAAYLDSPGRDLDLSLDVRGTAFQRKVWQALRDVPAGRTTTYTEVARKVGSPNAIRAVGNACSTNNLAFAIPCHRVLHKDGSLSGGYHWGDDRQRALIDREAKAAGRAGPKGA